MVFPVDYLQFTCHFQFTHSVSVFQRKSQIKHRLPVHIPVDEYFLLTTSSSHTLFPRALKYSFLIFELFISFQFICHELIDRWMIIKKHMVVITFKYICYYQGLNQKQKENHPMWSIVNLINKFSQNIKIQLYGKYVWKWKIFLMSEILKENIIEWFSESVKGCFLGVCKNTCMCTFVCVYYSKWNFYQVYRIIFCKNIHNVIEFLL